jgi:hypothetical protein
MSNHSTATRNDTQPATLSDPETPEPGQETIDLCAPPAEQVASAGWPRLVGELDDFGCATVGTVLTPGECRSVSGLYDEAGMFRSTIDMARYRFGEGQYRYFAYPLPELVAALREAFYPRLLPVARDWARRLDRPTPWPDTLQQWLRMCHDAGQTRPTPILLRYRAGDWNALHRDLYGELVFPLQVVIGLDEPGVDHTGGEFMMVEQRPRAQSKGTVRALRQGEALIFTTRDRPVRSARGWSASPMRHGVSTLLTGTRHTLGLVLHDAT